MPPQPVLDVTAGALAAYAHPDDAEIPSRGTLAAWTAGGGQVDLPVLTRGERGSSRPAAPEALTGACYAR